MTQPASRSVLVTGDVTIDWNLARRPGDESHGLVETWDDPARMYSQAGGAALMGGLISTVAEKLRASENLDCQVQAPKLPRGELRPSDPRFAHSHALWAPFDESAWRVQGFLGLDPPGRPARSQAEPQVHPQMGDQNAANLIVLDDANLGFRDRTELWPRPIESEQGLPWVVLKMARPVANGPLWEHLLETCCDRLIVVLTITDLRRTEVRISRRLSWERTAQDLVWELMYNPLIGNLKRCAHVIVSFSRAGAIRMSSAGNDKSQHEFRLYYDPKRLEGDWEESSSGKMIGYTITLTASIARELMLHPEHPDLDRAIQSGMAAQRLLFEVGYGKKVRDPALAELAFPTRTIADELGGQKRPLEVVEVRDPLRRPGPQPSGGSGNWTILRDRYADKLDEQARQIVRQGLDHALTGVPIGQFGDLVTVDRHEIESLRSIQSLIGEYLRKRQKRPLSLAVFGPPGSGKSFAIEEVARSMRGGAIHKVTFNLSQFDSPAGLRGAFHQVRDVGLSGQTPLVFWDEFDTTLGEAPLGWLRYFLSPMQDGTFEEGQITHPIGSCIFVFAGGTCARMADFGSSFADEPERAAAKVPDFLSRLRGYLDILGPNPQPSVAGGDPFYIVRRAILLRALFERHAPQLFHHEDKKKILNIDPGVLRALLKTRHYKHGARSIESLISMSSLVDRKSFERSSLPAEPQLDLHVDSSEFMEEWVHRIELTSQRLESLAEAAHEVFCEGRRRDGWVWGETKNEDRKTHPLLIEYAKLPESKKEANRVTVRNIPRKLEEVGCAMVPARGRETAWSPTRDEVEKLAQIEHDLWVKALLEDGYKPGTPTHPDEKLNEYLGPWTDIPEGIKQTDRDLVEQIPLILSRAGYTVVRLKH